jgi:hypothetical protein
MTVDITKIVSRPPANLNLMNAAMDSIFAMLRSFIVRELKEQNTEFRRVYEKPHCKWSVTTLKSSGVLYLDFACEMIRPSGREEVCSTLGDYRPSEFINDVYENRHLLVDGLMESFPGLREHWQFILASCAQRA